MGTTSLLPWVGALAGPTIALLSSVVYQDVREKRARRIALGDKADERADAESGRRDERDVRGFEATVSAYKEMVDAYKEQLTQVALLHKEEVSRLTDQHDRQTQWLKEEVSRLQSAVQDQSAKLSRLQSTLTMTQTAEAVNAVGEIQEQEKAGTRNPGTGKAGQEKQDRKNDTDQPKSL